MKNSVLDNFPPCPPAEAPPEKRKFYFYCHLAFSETKKAPIGAAQRKEGISNAHVHLPQSHTPHPKDPAILKILRRSSSPLP